jgi:hypothetical protein
MTPLMLSAFQTWCLIVSATCAFLSVYLVVIDAISGRY